jgi:hypothetical protein
MLLAGESSIRIELPGSADSRSRDCFCQRARDRVYCTSPKRSEIMGAYFFGSRPQDVWLIRSRRFTPPP